MGILKSLNIVKLHRVNIIEGDKGGQLIFDRFIAKPIFTQKLESPGFLEIEHQIN